LAYTFVGDKEPFYAETLEYIKNLNDAGIKASVDVYKTSIHAFDMLFPFLKISKKAKEKFEKEYLYAVQNYSAYQKGERKTNEK